MLRKVLLTVTGLVILAVVVVFSLAPGYLERGMNVVEKHIPYEISEQASQLHRQLVVGDWHTDSTLWKRDLADRSDRGHVDIPRLQEGNVMLQVFTTVTKSPRGQNYEHNETDAADNITLLALVQLWPLDTWRSLTARAVHQAEKLHELAERIPQDFRLIRSQQELSDFVRARQSQPKLVGGLIGTEGSHALDGELSNIKLLYDKGFRMMSLQHFFDNKLGGSLHGSSGAGLSEFGRQAVKQMQALDIILDVSHSSEQAVQDVLDISTKPLVVSHTGFKGHCDSPRNISDELMKRIADAGGLIAVGYWDGAVCGNSPQKIAEAILYGVSLVGADHVSLGSDFDGTVTTSFDTSELAVLTQALLDAGADNATIHKVMGGNMLLFLQANLPAE